MALQPLTKIDLSFWQKEKPYPVDLKIDINPGSAALELDNVVLSANSAYLYTFVLQPGTNYRFDMQSQFAEVHGFLTPSGTHDVIWANATGLSSIGPDRRQAIDITVDRPTEVTLTVFNPTDKAEVSFSFTSFANLELAIVEPPPPPPPPPAPTPDNIVRFTQLSTGNLLYTASSSEQALLTNGNFPDFRLDGPVFSGDDQPREGYIPVYRFFNLKHSSHFFTANEQERATLQNTSEFIFEEAFKFFVPGQASAGTIPVFRLQNLNTGAQLLTTNPVEKAYVLLSGDWQDQDIAFFAFPVLESTTLTHAQQVDVQLVGVGIEPPASL